MCDRNLRSPISPIFFSSISISLAIVSGISEPRRISSRRSDRERERERETIHSRGDRRNRFPAKEERSDGRFLVRRKYERTDDGRESERAKAQDTVRIESEGASIKEEAGQPRKLSHTSLKIRQSFLSPFQSQSLGP